MILEEAKPHASLGIPLGTAMFYRPGDSSIRILAPDNKTESSIWGTIAFQTLEAPPPTTFHRGSSMPFSIEKTSIEFLSKSSALHLVGPLTNPIRAITT